MKDEIKETIDYVFSLAYGECFSDEREDIKKAEDYITNLQEENKRLKELCDKYEEEHSTRFNDWVFDKRENERLKEINKEQANHLISKDNLSYEDYKSRNEKAIEYIGNGNIGIPRKTRNKFISILKGEDKDVKDKR